MLLSMVKDLLHKKNRERGCQQKRPFSLSSFYRRFGYTMVCLMQRVRAAFMIKHFDI